MFWIEWSEVGKRMGGPGFERAVIARSSSAAESMTVAQVRSSVCVSVSPVPLISLVESTPTRVWTIAFSDNSLQVLDYHSKYVHYHVTHSSLRATLCVFHRLRVCSNSPFGIVHVVAPREYDLRSISIRRERMANDTSQFRPRKNQRN